MKPALLRIMCPKRSFYCQTLVERGFSNIRDTSGKIWVEKLQNVIMNPDERLQGEHRTPERQKVKQNSTFFSRENRDADVEGEESER